METQEAISNLILLMELSHWLFNGGVFDKVGGEKNWNSQLLAKAWRAKIYQVCGLGCLMEFIVLLTIYIIQGTFFVHDILVAHENWSQKIGTFSKQIFIFILEKKALQDLICIVRYLAHRFGKNQLGSLNPCEPAKFNSP